MLSIARPLSKTGRIMPKMIGQTAVKKFDISMGGRLIEIPLKLENGETWLVRLDNETIDVIHDRLHNEPKTVKGRVVKRHTLTEGGPTNGDKTTVIVE